MKWPWVSRLAFEGVKEERDLLRARVKELEDQLGRMSRWDRGMTESPRTPREAMEKMPAELEDYYAGHANQKIARFRRNAAYTRRARGESWSTIMESVFNPPKEEEA